MTDINVPTSLPDMFPFKLRDLLFAALSTDPDYPVHAAFTRPLNPTDPSGSISCVVGDGEPVIYEIAGSMDPSEYEWNAAIQIFVKNASEIEGRNVRSRMLQGVRRTLFLPGTVSALMTLNDGFERVSRFRVRRIDFDSATARDATKQFFFLGSVEINFRTERL